MSLGCTPSTSAEVSRICNICEFGGKRQVLYVTNRPKMLCRGMHVLGSELLKSDQKIIRQHRIAGCPKGVEVGVSLRIIPRCEVY